MTRITGTPEYQRGTYFEQCLETWVRNVQRCRVMRVNWAGDVAPMLHSWSDKLILPDLQVIQEKDDGEPKQYWLEAKLKQTCGVLEVAGIRTTGCEEYLRANYAAVERTTMRPVYIAFGHQDQNEVRLARATSGSFCGIGAGRDMAYWDWDRLRLIACLAEVIATVPAPGLKPAKPLFGPADIQRSMPGLEAA